MDGLNEIIEAGVLAGASASPTERAILVISGVVMFGAWLGAYALIFFQCQREKTYGIPHPSICFNVSWEMLFSFALVAPFPFWAIEWGNRLWLLFDLALVYQLFRYGRKEQTVPWVRRNFYWVTVATILLCATGIYHFSKNFGDPYGLASSFIGNLTMSILFIGLVFKRPDLRGLSLGAAWLKMIGTSLGGAVFCYVWWPLQYVDGGLRWLPDVDRWNSFGFVYFLYLTIPIFDGLYIYLLIRRRRELRELGGVSEDGPPRRAADR